MRGLPLDSPGGVRDRWPSRTHITIRTHNTAGFFSLFGEKSKKKKKPSSVFLPRVEFTPVDGVRETAVHGGGKV